MNPICNALTWHFIMFAMFQIAAVSNGLVSMCDYPTVMEQIGIYNVVDMLVMLQIDIL